MRRDWWVATKHPPQAHPPTTMSLALTLRSLGTRRALLVHTRSMHSPFGPTAARTAPSTPTNNSANESRARLNVVASAPIEKFNGVPLGAYQISTPYHSGPEGNGAGEEMRTKQDATK